MMADQARVHGSDRDLWIFAYGSLMWRPDFVFEEAQPARLTGFHRSFCIYSTHHRGSPARPGLVLGLDRGRVCEGIGYRIAATNAAAVLAYLRQRELIYGVYRETMASLTLMGTAHREVRALAFIVERAHPSYAAGLSLAEQVSLIRGAKGVSGTNLDYLVNTCRHLVELGIRERSIERLLTLAGPHVARSRGALLECPSATAMVRAWRAFPVRARRIRPAEHRRFLYRLGISRKAQQSAG